MYLIRYDEFIRKEIQSIAMTSYIAKRTKELLRLLVSFFESVQETALDAWASSASWAAASAAAPTWAAAPTTGAATPHHRNHGDANHDGSYPPTCLAHQ